MKKLKDYQFRYSYFRPECGNDFVDCPHCDYVSKNDTEHFYCGAQDIKFCLDAAIDQFPVVQERLEELGEEVIRLKLKVIKLEQENAELRRVFK